MKIEVRPIEIRKWHGKSGKENFAQPKRIQALVNSNTMKYETGLTEEDLERLEKEIKYDLSDKFVREEAHPFWDSKVSTVSLENATQFFDTERPLDLIKVRIMQASRYVANSMKDYEDGKYPDATHVIFNEAEEVEVTARKVEIKNQAIIKCSQLSKAKKEQLILVLGGKNVKGKNTSVIEVELSVLIDKDPLKVLNQLGMDDEDLYLNALVLEAIQKGVLRRSGGTIKYFDHPLGVDESEAAHFLKNEEHQPIKLRILEGVK